jgi:UDPglucose 6-dehydrogenase
MARLCIVGTGHVGLVYAVAFALDGHEVVATDVDEKAIASLQKATPTFYEPGLDEMLKKAVRTKRLSFTTDVPAGVAQAEFIFLCVGTPSRSDGSIDLGYVSSAAETIGRGMRSAPGHRVVVVKSTVLPRTTEEVVRPALEKSSGKKAGRDFGLCMNPEFLREGTAVDDAMNPDRIVIGALDPQSADALATVYASAACPRLVTDLATAELIKYATNAFLATKVSFANDLANLCDAFGGIDVDRVVEGMALDPRINPRFLRAGLGFGGSCFPKDVRAIVAAGKARGYAPKTFEAALDVNESQPMRAVGFAEKALGSLKGKRIAILGLSFKGGSDDVRGSRALPLAEALLAKGATVVGHDPVANEAFARAVPKADVAPDLERALANADACIVHNDWPQWRALTSADFAGMRRRLVIDGRRILNRKAMDGVELHVLGG